MSTYQFADGGISVDLNGDAQAVRETNPVNTRVFPILNEDFEQVQTLTDLALSRIVLSDFPIVEAWRQKLFSEAGTPEICDELPRLLTAFLRNPENDKLPAYQRRAAALHYVFKHKTPLVKATDLLPGQTTTSFVGPVVYVDTIGYCIWPELKTVTTRAQNPFKIKAETAERLNKEIFPYWLNRKPVQEVARYSDYDSDDFPNRDEVDEGRSIDPPLEKRRGVTPKCHALMERVAFFLSDKATCVSHTAPDFERVLKYGIRGLSDQIERDLTNSTLSRPQKAFLQGVQTVFEGVLYYATHLARAAKEAGNDELERICKKVPMSPAETLHEALVSIWICYHLLLQENTNFGFSIGRFDQLLNQYYLNDWRSCTSQEDKEAYTKRAVELVCHFFLRCSDHVPLSTEGSETLFAGSGSNQALTVGGVHYKNGRVENAVNDMTYITLKAAELLSIRDPNVHARYHKEVHRRNAQGLALPEGEYDPYLRRICQINILTRATPAIHGDAAVAQAMAKYYGAHKNISQEEALEDAYDYTSIGCIEQNATGKHYGNTGSTLLVLPAVLELALFGGKHRSDGVGAQNLNLFYDETAYTTPPLTRLKSMEAFIEAFRQQLDDMAKHTVQCNNYLGRAMERVRPSPLLSGLFEGPINKPGGNKAKFRDVAAGGAKYNSAGVAIIGLADVIDAFCVLETLVFSGKISAPELLAAMEADFKAEEGDSQQTRSLWSSFLDQLQQYFNRGRDPARLPQLSEQRIKQIRDMIKHAPKYGAGVDCTPDGLYDNSVAVKYTHLLTEMIQEVFYQYRTHRGGRYLVGYWSMTNHAGFGMLAKAMPNGRRSGESFASGITPCPGIVKRNGDAVMILDHMLSITEVEGDCVTNGYTYNLSLTTRDENYFAQDTELFSRYMKTFFDNDGVLVQMCVSSIDDLKAAHRAATAANQANAGEEARAALAPYKDLMIRVAGYSAYFVTLSSQMREEIIQRANFALSDGVEQHTLAAI